MSHGGDAEEGDIDVAAIRACRLNVLQTFGDWKVWSVNGLEIRKHYVDFTQGGNPRRYPKWIGKREIWLDNANYREYRFVLLHELHEVCEMEFGGLSYDKAHLKANVLEVRARNDPSLTEGLIAEQIARLVPAKTARYGS